MIYNIESAPVSTGDHAVYILLWVRDVELDNGRGRWVRGRYLKCGNSKPIAVADGFHGKWNIPYWTPLPPDPE